MQASDLNDPINRIFKWIETANTQISTDFNSAPDSQNIRFLRDRVASLLSDLNNLIYFHSQEGAKREAWEDRYIVEREGNDLNLFGFSPSLEFRFREAAHSAALRFEESAKKRGKKIRYLVYRFSHRSNKFELDS